MGLTDLATFSDGTKLHNPKHLKKSQEKLKKAQRKMSGRTKGGKNYEKQRVKVAKLQRKVRNQRNDFLHKFTTTAIKNHDVIVIEDLSVQNMMKNHKLARSIRFLGRNMLEYKAKWYGKEIIVVDRFFASSKTCHCCGHKLEELPLSVRDVQAV